jgi:hypothetical protein
MQSVYAWNPAAEMSDTMLKRLIFVFSLSMAAVVLYAQRGWEAGFFAGTAFYFGDLNTNYSLALPNAAAGAMARFNFNERVCFRLAATAGRVEGDDARSKNIYEKARNLSFRSPVTDASALLEFNFLPYIHGSRDFFFTPYVFGGFTLFSFDPAALYDGEWISLRPLGTEGQFKGEEYYTVQTALAYGGGIKLDLGSSWSLNAELSARSTRTDYLDDVSTVYTDKRSLLRSRGDIAVALSDRSLRLPGLEDSRLGLPGTQRGNSKTKDAYVFLQAGLVYYFGSLRCPSAMGGRR